MDAPEAWDLCTGNKSVKVAMVDSGVWFPHPDLAGNLGNDAEIPNNGIDDDGNGFVDDHLGWDFANDDAFPEDECNHGTASAGIIGACGSNGIGGEGVCWKVGMIPVKVYDKTGYTNLSMSSEGLWYSVKLNPDVILAAVQADVSIEADSVFEVFKLAANLACLKNIAVVCPAGNFSNNNDLLPFYPANFDFPNIISVAATDDNDNLANWGEGYFSNYGASSVDVGAAGINCYSTFAPYYDSSQDEQSEPSIYGFFSGTSAAGPYVAGVCALVKAANPFLKGTDIKNILLESVDKVDALNGKVATSGRVNAYRAIKMALGNPLTPLKAENDFYTIPFNKFLAAGASINNWIGLVLGPSCLENDIIPVGAFNIDAVLYSNPDQGGKVDFPSLEKFIYSPAPQFIGTESFAYQLTADKESAIGKVTVTVLPPVAEDDAYMSSNNEIIVNSSYGVMENDGFNPDLPKGYTPEITQMPNEGTLVPEMANGVWTGSFTYTRTNSFGVNAKDTFKYKVSFPSPVNGMIVAETNEATVTLTTGYVPKFNLVWEEWIPSLKPIFDPISYIVTTAQNTPIEIGIQFPVTARGNVEITRYPKYGTVTLSTDNQLKYTPATKTLMLDTFQLSLNNGENTRLFDISIQPDPLMSTGENIHSEAQLR